MLIRLLGPGGAGKSTAGKLLAEQLGVPFADLDDGFLRIHGEIGGFIATQGYPSYAAHNIGLYRSLVAQAGDTTQVMALSSGFMAYPPDIHPQYAAIRQELLASPRSFVLLPSLERETCVAETVRRQRTRPFARSAEREEQVIRARFPLYRSLPIAFLGTMRPAAQVAADIASRIASDPAQGAA